MIVKILGTGCPSCKKLEHNTKEAIKELKVEVVMVKIEDIQEIITYGVMSMPTLVINDEVVSSGRILSVEEIKNLLSKKK